MHKFYLFLSAALLLNITPGSDMMYVIARSLSNGKKGGIVSSLGITTGCLFHILLAVFGLSTLISSSALTFEIIKYLGASYLFFLGFKLVVNKNKGGINLSNLEINDNKKLFNIFKQGIITNILNPKVILFFLAFLPQFVDKNIPNLNIQLFTLGFIFTISGTLVNIIVALIIGLISDKLMSYPNFWKIQEKISGFLIIGIGIRLAVMNQK